MKIENNMFVYKVADKKSEKREWNAPSRCPFCGHILRKIDGSNVKVCVNKNCERSQSFYKLAQ